jgi:hypothetical protein
MGAEDHQRGSKKNQFCAIPGTPCECGNDYIKVCNPGWGEFTFERLIRLELKTIAFGKKYEAHHLLCVSSVSKELVANENIDSIVRETVWCINADVNMLGMPLWGHTVKYYCTITAAGGAIANVSPPAPPFANIPQHDWDHNCKLGYRHETDEAMKGLAKDVQDAGHEFSGQNLKGELESLSKQFRGELSSRGGRNGGTHNAWQQGSKQPTSRWYEPFSMASTANLTEKGFPVRDFDNKVAAWIKRIAAAISGGA